jgi:hypothetical protein
LKGERNRLYAEKEHDAPAGRREFFPPAHFHAANSAGVVEAFQRARRTQRHDGQTADKVRQIVDPDDGEMSAYVAAQVDVANFVETRFVLRGGADRILQYADTGVDITRQEEEQKTFSGSAFFERVF